VALLAVVRGDDDAIPEIKICAKKSGKDFGFTTFNTQMKPELRYSF